MFFWRRACFLCWVLERHPVCAVSAVLRVNCRVSTAKSLSVAWLPLAVGAVRLVRLRRILDCQPKHLLFASASGVDVIEIWRVAV